MTQSHILILKVFDELKFNLGKKTLVDFLKGNVNNTIEKNCLDELNSYGCLYTLDVSTIHKLIDKLILEEYLSWFNLRSGFKVISRTNKGFKELIENNFDSENFILKLSSGETSIIMGMNFEEFKINEEDRKLFLAFDFFLNKFNDEQKKAIITNEKNVLCIAGAGCGKTTVLTKRIEFLIRFKGVKTNEILAITFTKKAKEEMNHKLEKLNIFGVKVETFNSFCEGILKKFGKLLYGDREVRVIDYKNKIKLVNSAFKNLGFTLEHISQDYFNKKQLRDKSLDELFFIFVNDIFTILDYYKNLKIDIEKFYDREKNISRKKIAKLIYEVVVYVNKNLKENNFRDFSDQIFDALILFEQFKDIIPDFKHVLIDEFQDVNLLQFELLKLLNCKNVFAVGDPRQAIYGWRGSDIKYIIDFQKEFSNSKVIFLKMNYRSNPQIVNVFNEVAKPMGLPNLEAFKEKDEDKHLYLVEMSTENLEKEFVAQAILNSKNIRSQIYVLARTNRILEGYAEFFSKKGIKYAIKAEEEYKNSEPSQEEVILATVHSIKGMEAEEVYIVSANSLSFPNKVQDNFILSLVKKELEYDKDGEELRLFYVALSRAKEKLIISYTGNITKYANNNFLRFFDFKTKNRSLYDFSLDKTSNSKANSSFDSSNSTILRNMIKNWRGKKSSELNLPSYMVLSNKAVDSLVTYRPIDKDQLENLDGFGKITVLKYGDELISLINGK